MSGQSFGQLLRRYRRQCRDPLRGGLLTQERFGELIGIAMGWGGYSGAAVSDWERDKSRINADDRPILVMLVKILHQCGGLQDIAQADELLHKGNYRALDENERLVVFGAPAEVVVPAIESPEPGPPAPPFARYTPESRSSQRRQRQLILLQKVKSFWVDGVQSKALAETALIRLRYRRMDQVIARPLDELVGRRPDQRESKAAELSIYETFRSTGQALLILGEPGSGKTMTLIGLAADLIKRARSFATEPIPVLLNLVSWSERRQPLDGWIVNELTAKYQIPRKAGQDWLESDELVLLLDGFDEVPEGLRARCAQEINRFRIVMGLTGIVVCSRSEEYLAAGVPLTLGGAISLLPLTEEQIDNYLASAGPRLSNLQAAVDANNYLQELARMPLILSIMSRAFAYSQERLDGVLSDPVETGNAPLTFWRRQLVGIYVNTLFHHRSPQTSFSEDETTAWLSWLAKKMFDRNHSTFLLEQLQPVWLKNSRWRRVYMLLSGLSTGFVGGIIIWLFLQLLRDLNPVLPAPMSSLVASFLPIGQGWAEVLTIIIANILLGLVAALIQGVYFERLLIQQIEIESGDWRYRGHLITVGLVVGSLTLVAVSLLGQRDLAPVWAITELVLFVTAARFVYGHSYLSEVRTVEALGWSWTAAAKGLIIGLILAFIAESVGVVILEAPVTIYSTIILGSGGLFLGGLRGRRVEKKNRPNQGIYLSLRNSFIAAGISGLALGLITWLIRSPTYALLSTLLVFFIAGSLFGGGNVIKHFTLRVLLWIEGRIPWRFASFLNYAASLTFLRKVGGGYIFSHGLIQQYFASLYLPQDTLKGLATVKTAGIPRAINRAPSRN